MAVHVTGPRQGFGPGLSEVTRVGEAEDDTGIALAILKLEAGESVDPIPEGESAYLLLAGRAEVSLARQQAEWSRGSLFDELPHCLHVCAGEQVRMRCRTDVEIALLRTANRNGFAPRLFAPGDVRDEARGKGQLKNTALRFVRTVFDGSNTDASADLVLGEVITLPGRWSSYPPHHHPQPEIYHYRFTSPHGYGFAQLGDRVLTVRHGDTVKITGGMDHPQVAAPGYGMYYLWVIRHLPGHRYTVPEFTKEHAWTMTDGARHWWPAGVDDDA